MIARIKTTTLILFLCTAMVSWSCAKDKDDTKDPEGSCYVVLASKHITVWHSDCYSQKFS